MQASGTRGTLESSSKKKFKKKCIDIIFEEKKA